LSSASKPAVERERYHGGPRKHRSNGFESLIPEVGPVESGVALEIDELAAQAQRGLRRSPSLWRGS
jgi:hypothetical protein